MPTFSPLAGVRYTATADLDDLVAPPYDVISPEDRAALVARSNHNAVRLELPAADGNEDQYAAAARLWRDWLATGVLARDDSPAFYGYRMSYNDEAGRPRHTTGVLGALALEPPGTGILPHEHTTPKDKADRLNLLRACRANLSPIWGLVPSGALAGTVPVDQAPTARATDADGTRHDLWRITDPARIAEISAHVATDPVVVADGHHRYEVALAYRDESDAAPGAGAILTYLVELSDEELSVRAIHRLVGGLPEGFDLVAAFRELFDVTPTDPADETIIERMNVAGALALVTPNATWLLRPTATLLQSAGSDLDSSRLDVALATLPSHELVFQHGWDRATTAVAKGSAQAAVLLRPATVDQIAATGRGRGRMPPKTTFFYPKLRTGLVFRSLDT